MSLLALGGYAEAGKDAIADHLEGDLSWSRDYFSSALEEALLKLDPWIITDGIFYERYSELHKRKGYTESKQNPEVRRLLQVLGTEVGREMFGKSVWVNIFDRKVKPLLEAGENVVVTGVRFRNEVIWARRRGGHAVWVDRGGEPVNDHASDNSLSEKDFDHTIKNTGTLAELYAGVDLLLKEIV